MYGIIECLYTPANQQAFQKLYVESDLEEQMLLRSTIAEAFKDCPKILPSHGYDWIICTLSSFQQPADDTLRVTGAILRNMDHFQFGLIDEKIKWKQMSEIADTCLIGLGFFRKRMEVNHQKKAAPSPEYYSRVGSIAFKQLGWNKIGENFGGWTDFISKEMTND